MHAGAFLVLAAVPVGAALSEWRYVLDALAHPYHPGGLPQVGLLLASLAAVVGLVVLLGFLARGRSAPLWASLCVLGGVALAFLAGRGVPDGTRSEQGANLAFLSAARRVHLEMVGRLQEKAAVSVDEAPWQEAFQRASGGTSRVTDRAFRAVFPRVRRVASPDDAVAPRVPGDLWVYVSPDGVTFDIRVVGFEQGEPALLRDDTGTTLVLRGLFNLDLPAAGPSAPSWP